MKAFVLSIGEKTTQLCIDQLKRYGFEVILLDGDESMASKYERFVNEAFQYNDDGFLKVDADVIVNEKIKLILESYEKKALKNVIHQLQIYNFYLNDVSYNGIMYYPLWCIEKIRSMHIFSNINRDRPESSALRLTGCSMSKVDIDSHVFGLHGFFQDEDDVMRVMAHRGRRKHHYDAEFISKINELWKSQK